MTTGVQLKNMNITRTQTREQISCQVAYSTAHYMYSPMDIESKPIVRNARKDSSAKTYLVVKTVFLFIVRKPNSSYATQKDYST